MVASDADTGSRVVEIGRERLEFSGVWSGAPKKVDAQRILSYCRVHGSDLASAPRPGKRRSGANRSSVLRPKWSASALGDTGRQRLPDIDDDVYVEGRIDGDCVCRQLVIKLAGRLTGDAVAEEVIVSGSVKGRILAKTVGLTRQAVVSGDVNYCDLVVERQATLEARMQRISRARWDENAVEQPGMVTATAQAVA